MDDCIFSWHEHLVTTINGKTWIFLILSGLATGVSWLFYFKALQNGDVNKVAPIDKSSTILTMLLAIVFLGEAITIIKVIAMILIGVGTYLMIQKKEVSTPSHTKVKQIIGKDLTNQNHLLYVLKQHSWLTYAFASTIFASLTAILGKVGIEGVDSNLGTAIRTVVVLVMSWGVVFITGSQHSVKNINAKNWLFLMLSGVVTGCSWLCYYRALKTGPASIVVPIDKLSILVTIVFSYIVLKEKLNMKSTAGLVSIVIGTLILLV